MISARPPVVADLFAGVGGMSLGAARAGFDVALAVDNNAIALATHEINFPHTKHLLANIEDLTGMVLLEQAHLKMGELDGIIGGPPCQGFSDIGRRQLDDSRNNLFGHFFRLIGEANPRFFVAENVPGLLRDRNREIVSAALARIPDHYEISQMTRVRASDYGAPTSRERVFIVGYDPRRVSGNEWNSLFKPLTQEPIKSGFALQGLPRTRETWQTEIQGLRKIRLHEKENFFTDRLYNCIPSGVGSIHALHALSNKGLVSGNLGTIHTQAVKERFSLVPPGGKDLVSKASRLHRDGFCPTLRAGTGPERGSYQAVRPIHHISPRVITPREAARLQGFPDWYQFHGTKWHSFRQIGNSVSPLVAEAILTQIYGSL